MEVKCLDCGAVYRISDSLLGKKIRCKKCRGVIHTRNDALTRTPSSRSSLSPGSARLPSDKTPLALPNIPGVTDRKAATAEDIRNLSDQQDKLLSTISRLQKHVEKIEAQVSAEEPEEIGPSSRRERAVQGNIDELSQQQNVLLAAVEELERTVAGADKRRGKQKKDPVVNQLQEISAVVSGLSKQQGEIADSITGLADRLDTLERQGIRLAAEELPKGNEDTSGE